MLTILSKPNDSGVKIPLMLDQARAIMNMTTEEQQILEDYLRVVVQHTIDGKPGIIEALNTLLT